MKRKQFIDLYIVQFLASYAAGKYDHNCLMGWPDTTKSQPVEDAEILAEGAWEQLESLRK